MLRPRFSAPALRRPAWSGSNLFTQLAQAVAANAGHYIVVQQLFAFDAAIWFHRGHGILQPASRCRISKTAGQDTFFNGKSRPAKIPRGVQVPRN